jgi:hypothetical protein
LNRLDGFAALKAFSKYICFDMCSLDYRGTVSYVGIADYQLVCALEKPKPSQRFGQALDKIKLKRTPDAYMTLNIYS